MISSTSAWKNCFAKISKNLATRENHFAEVSKNSGSYRSENNFIGSSKYIEDSSMMSNAAKCFDILATNLSILYNYFDSLTELFSDLCLTKF